MRHPKPTEIEIAMSRILVLECLLTSFLDTMVGRGRITHADLAVAIEATEAQLKSGRTEFAKLGAAVGSQQLLAQLEHYKAALNLS